MHDTPAITFLKQSERTGNCQMFQNCYVQVEVPSEMQDMSWYLTKHHWMWAQMCHFMTRFTKICQIHL